VQALAVVGQEPVWIFSTMGGPSSLAQAKGLRIAAGPASSSSFIAARLMLEHAGVRPADVQFDNATGVAAANALIDGKVDLVFQAAGEDSQAVQLLTRSSGIQLLGAEHAGALAAQNPRLQPLLLPQGAIELRGDIPPKDLTLMSLQTHLLVRPGVHPALQRALLDAAVEIHEIPNFLQRHGQFPAFGAATSRCRPRPGPTAWARARGWKPCCPTGRRSMRNLILCRGADSRHCRSDAGLDSQAV
jgi:hypothetical protein